MSITSNEQVIRNDSKDNDIRNISSCTVDTNDKKSEGENNKYQESLQDISDITDSIQNSSKNSIKSIDTEYSDTNNTSLSEINLNKSNISDEKNDVWNICENWHGLTGSSNTAEKCVCSQPTPKRTKTSYLDKCPEWDFIKNSKSFNLPLIINGSKCNPVKQGQLKINVHETCAFDSILQLVLSAIVAHPEYRNTIDSSSSDIFQLAKSIY